MERLTERMYDDQRAGADSAAGKEPFDMEENKSKGDKS